MGVEVENHLPTPSIHIDEETISRTGHAEFFRDFCGYLTYVRKNLIPYGNIVQRRNMLPRNNKNVNRSHRFGVPKSHDEIVFMYHLGRPQARYDRAKNTIAVDIAHDVGLFFEICRFPRGASGLSESLYLFLQRRDQFVEITDDTVLGDSENGCPWIFIDRCNER